MHRRATVAPARLRACLLAVPLVCGCATKDNPLWQLGGDGATSGAATSTSTTSTDSNTSAASDASTTGSTGSSSSSTTTGTTSTSDASTGTGVATSSGLSTGVDDCVLGSSLHCSGCNVACPPQQACENDVCILGRKMFVTDAASNAAFGGVGGADVVCQQAAAAAGLGGTWLAWIFDNPAGFDRYDQANVPYLRLDGVRIADDWNDLTDLTIQAPLEVSQTLQAVGGNVWTGLSQNGVGQNTCSDWTSDADTCDPPTTGPCGGAGQTNDVDFHWAGWFIYSCAAMHRLYCIEQ